MDDERPKDSDPAGDADAPAADSPAGDHTRDPRAWSNLWQVPTILGSLLLIALAVRVGLERAEGNDFDGVLTQVEQLLSENQPTPAGDILRDTLEPHIHEAEKSEQARFHAAVADWTSQVQQRDRSDTTTANLLIDRHYTTAENMDLAMSATRLERWVEALLTLDRVADAHLRLMQLNDLADAQNNDVPLHRRVDLFHRLVAKAIESDDIPDTHVSGWLKDYRFDGSTSTSEQLWAIARQAELRLNAGETRRAIDQLLVDMRRVEYDARPGERIDLAEIYTVLGRGHFELGQHAQATNYLENALDELNNFGRTGEAIRAEAAVLLGRIAMATGEVQDAFEQFDTVVQDFVGTDHELAGLLGRAETSSILGLHDEAQQDYSNLVAALNDGKRPTRGVSSTRVAASLVDRHDASLAMGELPLALEYAKLAEPLFRPSDVPVDVLFRIATTSRQHAENILAEAGGVDSATIEQRREANATYQQAGDYFVRHARMVTGMPETDDAWADSLWEAADAYDQAGLHEEAIAHFEEYLAGRSVEDPRRADVSFRLAKAHHALKQYETSDIFYKQVIDEHPRSVQATQSHVPLARCYMAMDRKPEAEQQLRQVLSGMHAVEPDAVDYRDALIELGTIYYNTERYIDAIEHLDQAAKRYPDDARHETVLFRLADSYRSSAMELAERIAEPTSETPAAQQRLDEQRRNQLRTAMEYFERVVAAHRDDEPGDMSPTQIEIVRSAYIHRADCAFHLDDFERAITLYDEAARRYSDHHASMHALIQIVNCYAALGEENRAAAAHRRALVRLRQLPDEAFDAPDSLMDRSTWERWLENTPATQTRAASAAES